MNRSKDYPETFVSEEERPKVRTVETEDSTLETLWVTRGEYLMGNLFLGTQDD